MSLFNLFSKKKEINKNPYALPISADYKYHAENLPKLLLSYNIFKPTFISELSSQYLRNIPTSSFKADDLLDGVDFNYAVGVLNHCQRLVSARYSVIRTLKNAKKAEAKFVEVEVFRPCPSCTKIPKKTKYKLTSNIPIYPCEDCKEEDICLFAYNLRW